MVRLSYSVPAVIHRLAAQESALPCVPGANPTRGSVPGGATLGHQQGPAHGVRPAVGVGGQVEHLPGVHVGQGDHCER